MGLGSIRKKIFFKKSSTSTATTVTQVPTVPKTPAQAPQIPVAHKSEIYHRQVEGLVSDGPLSASSSSDHSPKDQEIGAPDLLFKVLPVIRELIEQCEGQSNDGVPQSGASYRRTAKYAYIGRTLAAISLLEKHIESINGSGQADQFHNTITELAEYLESIFGRSHDDVNPIQRQARSDSVVSYHRLHDLWRHSQDPLKGHLVWEEAQKHFSSFMDVEWKDLSQSLASFIDQLQYVGHDVKEEKPEQDRPTILRRPLPDVGEFIDHSFCVMTCTCKLHSIRELSLRLCTYKGSDRGSFRGNVTILSKNSGGPLRQWAEVQVHDSQEIQLEGRESNVKFVVTGSSPQDIPNPTRTPSFPLDQTACICDCYQRAFSPEFWRLNIKLYKSKLFKYWTDKRILLPAALQHQVNLKELISPNGSTMSGMAKMTLSVILAYSMFYLYGGSWAKGTWKRENIVFFADGNAIPMRPFLKVPPPSDGDEGPRGDDDMSFHRYPEFLELGIMLLEVHFGQSLETMLGRDQSIESVDEYFAAASEVYDKKKFDIISRGLRHAVESCLKPDFGIDLGMEDPDNDELRSKIFESVVQPLEEELERAFQEFISIDSLDEQASVKIQLPLQKPNPGPLPREQLERADKWSRRRGPVKQYRHNPSGLSPQQKGGLERSRSSSPMPQRFELFSNESKTIKLLPDAQSATDDWIERFGELIENHDIDCNDTNRLRVAILDTGIDINHPMILQDSRIKECKSWTGTPADKDSSGHGTHIANSILDLTRNVDIYIAKITENNILENADHIAEAINFACDEWEVDIISLSFGFQRGIPSIQKAIDRAVSYDHNIIIFAAASNDASNTPRAYPASHDRVICVHSADGQGNRSTFNPTAVQGTDNFCIVGEDIEAAWPISQTQYKGIRRMSGTSFATPIGVAVAAFMLGLVERHSPDHAGWLTPLKSYHGVRAIFCALTQKRDAGYDLVNPLYNLSGGINAVQKVLNDIEYQLNR